MRFPQSRPSIMSCRQTMAISKPSGGVAADGGVAAGIGATPRSARAVANGPRRGGRGQVLGRAGALLGSVLPREKLNWFQTVARGVSTHSFASCCDDGQRFLGSAMGGENGFDFGYPSDPRGSSCPRK